MAGIGKEAAAVGEHPDEPAQQPFVCQILHLPLHAVFVILEPPRGAQLHLGGDLIGRERRRYGSKRTGVLFVQGEKDGFRKLVRFLHPIQKPCRLPGHGKVADGIEAAKAADLPNLPGIDPSGAAHVKLHGPAPAVILFSQPHQHMGTEAVFLLQCGDFAF